MNKYSKYKLGLSLLFASLAAIGNIPYGYRFAYTILSIPQPYIHIAGYIFSAAATLANIALGGYSLMSIKKSDLSKDQFYAVALSVLGATPAGFICFLGFFDILPVVVNIVLSVNVTFVNSGINLRAILNMLNALRNIVKGLKKNLLEIVFRVTGSIAGAAVSTVGYAAASASLVMLFLHFQLSESLARQLSYTIAIFAWIPAAALFSYSTQQVLGDIYLAMFAKTKQPAAENKYLLAGIIILSILSASSFTQMVVELFRPESNIPEFLKTSSMQLFIYNILAPVTFFSSASVNLFALRNLLKYIKK